MKKLIIDLRNNPGGDVDATLAIADLFIRNSDLLYITYKDPSKNVVYVATDSITVSPDVEIAILINGGTASSAEIFSSAMRDSGRAKLFGTKTFGKGIMQLVSSFGEGYISVTTASFTGPSGETIHKEGVKPDIEVEDVSVLEEEMDAYTELLKSKAVSKFVDENPAYTDDNLAKFADQNAESGLRREVLVLVARNEYLSRMNYDDRPLADIKYDIVCKTAYDYLQTYELTSDSTSQMIKTDKRVVNF
jgi:carboxyl-terminal processing protease